MNPADAFHDTQSPDSEWGDDAVNSSNSFPAPWACLVAIDRSNPDIDITELDTVVGRAHINGNKKVSKFHCRILKDGSGQAFLSNLSKNGTFMNGLSLDKEQHIALQHGAVINLGPSGPGVPQYIFHVPDKSSGCEKKVSDEILKPDSCFNSAKRLKLMKVQDELKCCICLGTWHDVVTVAPCLHSFCNGCFSEWYKKKGMSRCNCPQCRQRVVFVKKNHILSSIIKDYVQEFPSLGRPSEETAHLDQLAIVGNNFVNVGGSDSCTSGDDEDEDEDVEPSRCPQCPRSNALNQGDAFVCEPQTLHLQCVECSMFLPERADINVPQKCGGCSQVFCGLYWQSQNAARSDAVLAACTMRKVGQRTATTLSVGAFLGNAYEQDVTRRYLEDQSLQVQDVIMEWLGKMDRGETDILELPSRPQLPFSELWFCIHCEELLVSHLLYKFRLSVPKDQLPADAAAREDCWYGRLCRTQFHRDAHARKFNHVCESTSMARSS